MSGKFKKNAPRPFRPLWFLPSLAVCLLVIVLFTTIGPSRLFRGSPIAAIHDRLILPLLVGQVLTDPLWFTLLLLCAIVLLLLWPHFRWYRGITFATGVAVIYWIIVYDMWYHLPMTAALLAGVLIYLLARYHWEDVLALAPILSRRIFISLESFVDRHYRVRVRHNGASSVGPQDSLETPENENRPAVDLYFDAIRALCVPPWHREKNGESISFWNRSDRIPEIPHLTRWETWFAIPARWYRRWHTPKRIPSATLGSVLLWPLARLLVARRLPAQLEVPWLEQLLRTRADRCFAELIGKELTAESWRERFLRWAQYEELLVEYHLFDPAQHGALSPTVLWAAEKYDEMSRAGLVAQMGVLAFSAKPGWTEQWVQFGKIRLYFIRRAMILRGHVLHQRELPVLAAATFETLWEHAQRTKGPQRAVILAQAIGLAQWLWYHAREIDPAEILHHSLQLATEGEAAGAAADRALLWKLLELACDLGYFRVAQELVVREEIREDPPLLRTSQERTARPGEFVGNTRASRNALLADLLEGYLSCWSATTAVEFLVQRQAYRHAFASFCRAHQGSACRLREHIHQVAEATAPG
jgi:hypothetical protein